ncbi:MAG: DUF6655 family protein [Pirellula sp.]
MENSKTSGESMSLGSSEMKRGKAWGLVGCFLACVAASNGCGTTKSVTATEQLLMSDAVDSTISKIDFRPLTGYKVFLDTTYMASAGKPIPGVPMQANLVTSDYVISSIRQQLTAAGCQIVDSKETADIICEARCGALGTDGHNVTYGIPAINIFGGASTLIATAPALPSIPEISFAKKDVKSAASKIAVFAYDRETREPLWQSGIAQAGSNAKDTWFLGIGPIQQGTIYRGPRFAGRRIGRDRVLNDEVPRGDSPNGIDPRTQITFANPLFQPADEEILPSEDSQEKIASGAATAKEPYGAKKGVKAKLASDVK